MKLLKGKREGLTRKEEILEFWETNYQYNDEFALYLKCNPRTQEIYRNLEDTPTLGAQ